MTSAHNAVRILAGDIEPGMIVARSRNHPGERVNRVERGPVSVRLIGEAAYYGRDFRSGGYTIARPRQTAQWWRFPDAPDAPQS